ncbi:L,D-transpeptidase family protein [Candidatus Pelagibacter communis]|uniref:L,D-transpeptidase family protein n=1 Tax=Pelagibacter ubique TaxID=198252 RepID=UPI00094C39AC|nr:L,D-transpeptidase family protein [Candidatus Pelagibacter ubique]|tara:strand:+ start:1327 stop:1818 length:492 start_codon:yes stop_codon:yes gene_type:complete
MQIIIKNKDTLLFDEFKFKCSIGKKGVTLNKKEGDFKTPKGTFSIGPLYYRKKRYPKLKTKLLQIPIQKNMGWCDDVKSKHYNKLIKINKKIRHEKMFRRDENYDLVVVINYNTKKPVKNKGSAIFLHLTNNYKKTLGCISLKKRDMLILLKLIDRKTIIKIL